MTQPEQHPPHPSMTFPYLSNCTFLRCPSICQVHKVIKTPFAVAGVPWDGCVTNRPGARFGPKGIREASHMLCDGIHPLFDVTPLCYTSDAGDLMLPNTSLVEMRKALHPKAVDLFREYHMVWLGGDHSITLPLLTAAKETRYGEPIACIHFDAHCDTWKDHFGEPSGHGTWVYEAIEQKIARPECFFQFGIRSSGERAAREYVRDKGGMIFTGRDLRGLHTLAQLQPVIDTVKERLKQYGNPPVYITFDIDCLDPAFAPGTGTPEPGGLTSAQALTLIEEFAWNLQCIGMDITEVAPAYDHAELTTSAAAHLVWTYLSAQVAKLLKHQKRD